MPIFASVGDFHSWVDVLIVLGIVVVWFLITPRKKK
jgi:hypothetical protein